VSLGTDFAVVISIPTPSPLLILRSAAVGADVRLADELSSVLVESKLYSRRATGYSLLSTRIGHQRHFPIGARNSFNFPSRQIP